MLKSRIVPVLLWDGVQAVQSKQFQRPFRNVGSMMQHIENMESRQIDELVILDVMARNKGYKPQFEDIKEFTSKLFCPLAVGGGIDTLDDIKELLNSGADKVVINTKAISEPNFITKAADKFGSQCITVAINYCCRRIENSIQYFQTNQDFTWISDILMRDAVKQAVNAGAGEILLTDVLQNGQMKGYDTNAISEASYDHNTPVVPFGGCGKPQHMVEAFKAGAHAVAASSMFLFRDYTPANCAKIVQEAGFNVR